MSGTLREQIIRGPVSLPRSGHPNHVTTPAAHGGVKNVASNERGRSLGAAPFVQNRGQTFEPVQGFVSSRVHGGDQHRRHKQRIGVEVIFMVVKKQLQRIANKGVAENHGGANRDKRTPPSGFVLTCVPSSRVEGLPKKLRPIRLASVTGSTKLGGRGLARIAVENREDLRKICRFFGIKRTRLLWLPA